MGATTTQPTYQLRCQCYPGRGPATLPAGWTVGMLERFERRQCQRRTGCRCSWHRMERVS